MILGSRRILSLLPGATEILFCIGAGDCVVGVSEDCDWPKPVHELPEVSLSQIDSSETSQSIDRQVRSTLHSGRSIYHLDEERLEELGPDLIVTQEQCDVCAPTFDQVQEFSRRLEGSPEVVSLEASTLSEVKESIHLLGKVTDRVKAAVDLVESLEKECQTVIEVVDGTDRAPRVACIEWLDPPFQAGHWVPEMVELVQGQPLGDSGEPSREVPIQEIIDHDPECLVLMPCGFRTDRAAMEGRQFIGRLSTETEFNPHEHRVHAVNGSFYFNRPGPRLWTGLHLLAGLLHPGVAEELDIPSDSFKVLYD